MISLPEQSAWCLLQISTRKKIILEIMRSSLISEEMDKYFVLLGCNRLLTGQVAHLRELGYKVIVVAWNEVPSITGDLYIRMDVKDSSGIVVHPD